jgi:hypothetical protein
MLVKKCTIVHRTFINSVQLQKETQFTPQYKLDGPRPATVIYN